MIRFLVLLFISITISHQIRMAYLEQRTCPFANYSIETNSTQIQFIE